MKHEGGIALNNNLSNERAMQTRHWARKMARKMERLFFRHYEEYHGEWSIIDSSLAVERARKALENPNDKE
jgi:hypothetical protein